MSVTRIFGPLQDAVVGNNNIEEVENFIYLGSQLCNEGGSQTHGSQGHKHTTPA